MSHRPGDVVTDEPDGHPDLILRDRDGDPVHWADGHWVRNGIRIPWAQVAAYGSITVVSVPAPGPAPEGDAVAELEAQADWLETWASDCAEVTPEDRRIYGLVARRLRTRSADLRGAVRTPMPELDAPAVVRHAGRLLARPEIVVESEAPLDRCWMILHGDWVKGACWLTWAEVLALDPTTDPVPVDLTAEPPASTQERTVLGAVLDAEPTARGTVVEDAEGAWWGRSSDLPGTHAWTRPGGGVYRCWAELHGPVRLIR